MQQNALGFVEMWCDDSEDVHAEINAIGAVDVATGCAPSLFKRTRGVNPTPAQAGEWGDRREPVQPDQGQCEADFIGTQAEALWRLSRLCNGTTSGEF
jgi:hypothetical protein